MSKSTAGPWALPAVDANNRLHVGQVVDGDGATICIAYGNSAETLANARLIAAAPDLLRELADLVDWLTTNQRTIEGEFDMAELLAPARAAIARATTQGD